MNILAHCSVHVKGGEKEEVRGAIMDYYETQITMARQQGSAGPASLTECFNSLL
jgi:hypothetical protein